jgi:hypothetical protein
MAFDRANLPTDIATLHQIILAQDAEAEAEAREAGRHGPSVR